VKRVYTGVSNLSSAKANTPPTGPSTALTMGRTYIVDFPWPSIANNNNVITRREGNVIKVKGLKICRLFQYDQFKSSGGDIGDIEVHYCVLQLKNDEDNTELSAEMVLNFFRDNSVDSQSSSDFPTYTAGSSWDMKMNCLPINPNNKVNILMHKKHTLQPKGFGHNFDGAIHNYWKFEHYMKVNKDFSFKNVSSNLPSKRLFEFFWYNTVTPSDFPADPVALNYVTTDATNTVYYGEPDKCCYRKTYRKRRY